jgi:hypothetical protein
MSSLTIALARLFLALARGLRDPEFRALLVLLLLVLLGGTLFYATHEGWAWIDALYFSVMTLLTVGSPMFAPSTTLGKIFTMVYALGGIGLMLTFVTRLATIMVAARTSGKADMPEDD